ncbi:MAG: hypothetical protein GWN87_01210, partial [Desulfuromonadales bacterium]|nr:hypothetical protein [Desulfuromonadales bacterium]
EPLQELLAGELPTAECPDETFEGNQLPAEFVPALLAARAAAAPDRGINLRQGDFAYRGSLAPFKGRLIAAALLLSVAFVALAAGAWLSYS